MTTRMNPQWEARKLNSRATRRMMRGPRGVRVRMRLRKLTAKEITQLRLINAALDGLTEFGVETMPREILMQRVGGAITVLELLKEEIG